MGKRRSALDASQLGFSWNPTEPACRPAELAGHGRRYAAAVARALKDDPRPREVIAAAMSVLLDEDVTRWMLDAYASEARETHTIPAHRFDALVAVTMRPDLLAALIRPLGLTLFVGEEIHAARLGHLVAQESLLKAEIRRVKDLAQPIIREEAR